ncbi:cytidine deaminase [Vallitalea longa]|uniref:Cytidine deaminase n=1 Tax=Vallitalea longa TaxID=2936439 RepID=A0A9W5YB72_9FIRM|nr:cytidine deaminase [Vallitalea longa]GKX29466.1 cytidine deaminase [Vallitalea longa]
MNKNIDIEQEMYKRAVEFIKQRYPVGWGGAAVIHTHKDKYLISVALEVCNASVEVCIETGAMCEAEKYNEKVTHCLCVVRDDERSPFKILSPCGVCQERLRYWGEDVKVAVTTKYDKLKFVCLKELQPYHWTGAYPKEELEHYSERD